MPSRAPALLLRLAAAVLVAAGIAACGGSVSAPASPQVDSPTISILPNTATMYSGLPTTFILSGGTGVYVVTSSNQAILPIAGSVVNGAITLVPNPVTADTPITLTARDTGSATPVTATLTVKPGTINNALTITPNALQSTSCNPGICSGGDAEVRVTLSQGGIPLAARGVRFSVVSGDFRFITTPAGVQPEQTTLTIDVATDQSGVARARIRTTALAPNQTALLEVTDLGSGAFQRTSFAIAQFTGNTPAFFTVPSGITFTGPFAETCASSGGSVVSIFGGSPPYTVSGSQSAFSVTPSVVGASGGQFQIVLSSIAQCVTNAPIAVTDATGRTITLTVTNVAGTGTAPAPPVSVSPSTLSLACSFGTTAVKSSLVISGGSGTFGASSDHPRVDVVVANRTVTVQRLAGRRRHELPGYGRITVTDGNTTAVATLAVPANCP